MLLRNYLQYSRVVYNMIYHEKFISSLNLSNPSFPMNFRSLHGRELTVLVSGYLQYVSFRNVLSKTGKTDLTGVTGERLPNNRIHYKAVFLALSIFVITDKEGTQFWEAFKANISSHSIGTSVPFYGRSSHEELYYGKTSRLICSFQQKI